LGPAPNPALAGRQQVMLLPDLIQKGTQVMLVKGKDFVSATPTLDKREGSVYSETVFYDSTTHLAMMQNAIIGLFAGFRQRKHQENRVKKT